MITLTNENKNNISLTEEDRVNSPTWDEAEMTWDETTETWDSQSKPIFTVESKNNINLTFETK